MPEITLGTGAVAWISFIITVALGMAAKDLITTAVSGFLFWWNKSFNEGDHVYINGEPAVINKIGLRQTVFRVMNGRGETWLFVYNHKISNMKLEKVIIPTVKKVNTEEK